MHLLLNDDSEGSPLSFIKAQYIFLGDILHDLIEKHKRQFQIFF